MHSAPPLGQFAPACVVQFDVIGSSHQAIRTGAEQGLRAAQEDPAVDYVGDGSKGNLLAVARGVDALQGLEAPCDAR